MLRPLLLALALPACALRAPATDSTPADGTAGASGPTQITVLYMADLHGQLEPHPELFWGEDGERIEEAGGLARIGAAVERIREEVGGQVLFLDAGDTIQGSGVAALTEGEALVEPLNALGLDGAIPGNWEVVYGPQVMAQRLSAFDHPVFAANVYDGETGERLFEPWLVKEVGGVRIGVLGFTDPDVPTRQPPAYSAGLTYSGAEQLPGLVQALRTEHEVDVVLLLSHIGLSKAVALAGQVPGVDAHLSSDTHERTYAPIEVGETWVVEPGGFGSFLGRLDLWVDDGAVVDKRWELIELTAADYPEEDPAIAAIVERVMAPHRATLNAEVGAVAEPLARYAVVETPLDALLADALREAAGTEIALSNGFRFGAPLLPGPVRVADLWNLYPVVNPLKKGLVSGKQLRDFWERELENVFAKDPTRRFGGWVPRPSGMTLTFVADAPMGERVQEIRVGGELLEDDRLYTITACEREGEPVDTVCRIPNVRDAEVLDIDPHEAVAAYLQKHSPVRAPEPGRVVGLDLPRVLRTQN